MIRVSALTCYPVKSCRGIALESAEVTERGLRHDREWMVVDAEGRFLSQRTRPELARVRVALASEGLLLSAPGLEELTVPLACPDKSDRTVTIWRDTVVAESAGKDASRWFSRLLGAPCELVRMPADSRRRPDPGRSRPDDRVGFADAFPFLLLAEASLAELNRRLERPVPMDRFRPNIVVAGCAPHAEDSWTTLRIGPVLFRVAKPCARCVITTTDQETGTRGPEPLRTLATYRTVDGRVLFGQNLLHEGRGTIRVGDPCEVEPAGVPGP